MSRWIPERLVGAGGDVQCRWIDAEGARYTDPFFELTTARIRRERPERQWSSAEELLARGLAAPPASPTAFVFHVSRCGSTLLAQLFAEGDRAAVISEPPVLDDVLRSGWPDRDRLFDATLRLLARGAGPDARLLVKTDAWHVLHAATLRRLYPETPFIFLYRSPAAVLRSHARGPGSHMVPGVLKGVALDVPFDSATMSLDQYGVRVLEKIYGAMLDASRAGRKSLLVSYDEGFPAAFLRAASWLGLSIDGAYRARIEARCGFHGKRPEEVFAGDAPNALPAVDDADLESIYRDLEEARLAAT